MSAIPRPFVLMGMGQGGTYKFADGTAAAPSITFASDTDTGFYRSGADQIGVALGGTAVFSFNTTGAINSTTAISLAAGGSNQNITLTPSGTGFVKIGSASGTLLLIGTGTNSSNGALQLATHTTIAGGLGLGTETGFFRYQAGGVAIQHFGGTVPALAFRTNVGEVGVVYHDGTNFNVNSASPIRLTVGGVAGVTVDTALNTTLGGLGILKNYTVASLPAAAAGNTGALAFVTDATQAAGTGIGGAPTGGGAVKRAVYSTGAAWLLL